MFRKRTLVIVISLLLLGAGAWYLWGREKEVEMQTEVVRRGTVAETVSVTGKLVPSEYADLSFRAVGTIKEVRVKEGDVVKAGQVIVTLDQSSIEAELADARTTLAKAEATERQARRAWRHLNRDEKAIDRLATEQAREDIRIIQAKMKDYRLIAPLSGVVSQLDARPGEVATIGSTVARIAGESSELLLEARVPESDIVKIATGMSATVDFDALPSGETLEAEVGEIDQAATVIQDVVSYIAKLRLKSTDSRLKEGMTADVDIETKKSEQALVVPFRSLTKEGNQIYAEVLQTDGSLRRVEVEIGIEGDDGTVEIKSGLREGDQVTLGTKQKN